LGEGVAAEGRVVRLQHGLEVAGDVRLGLQVLRTVERHRLDRHRRCDPGASLVCGSFGWRCVPAGSKRGGMLKEGGALLPSRERGRAAVGKRAIEARGPEILEDAMALLWLNILNPGKKVTIHS
jgi:hypothetical protein